MDNQYILPAVAIFVGLLIHAIVLGLWAGKLTSKVALNEKENLDLKEEIKEFQTKKDCSNNILLLKERRKSDEKLLETLVNNQRIATEKQEELNILISQINQCLIDIQRNIKC